MENLHNLYPDRWDITLFGHTMKKYGHRASFSFKKLVEHIAVPQRESVHWSSEGEDREHEKAEQKCFAPGTFKQNRRLKTMMEKITMMVWDVDDCKVTYDQGKDFCNNADLTYIMHTSYSHSTSGEKFRVIFPMARSIPIAYFEAFADVSQSTFMLTFVDTPDLQALHNRSSTYNCAYLTPHYRGDWNQGSRILDPYQKVQEVFQKMQDKKSMDFLDRQFSSTKSRTAHPCHVDDRTHRVASLNVDKGARDKFGRFLGAKLKGEFWRYWSCPSCGKKDATTFNRNGGLAFCNHKNSCGDTWLLPELASLKGWRG
jgi:hypothetical protein